MKIKGLKSHVQQVTFEGKHPRYGSISTITWNDLKQAIEARLKYDKTTGRGDDADGVVSIVITPKGLEVYTKQINSVHDYFHFIDKFRGIK